MNGRTAKKIRKYIYGAEMSPRFRQYRLFEPKVDRNPNKKKKPTSLVFIISDNARLAYQWAKKRYKAGGWKNVAAVSA